MDKNKVISIVCGTIVGNILGYCIVKKIKAKKVEKQDAELEVDKTKTTFSDCPFKFKDVVED